MGVGDNIRKIRVKKGITLSELATKIDMHPGSLSNIEKGYRNPSIDALNRIANALNVHLVDILIDDAEVNKFVNNIIKEEAEKFGIHDEDADKIWDKFSQRTQDELAMKLIDYFGEIYKREIKKLENPIQSPAKKEQTSLYPIKTTKIPVVGIIRAGEPILAEQNIIDYIDFPTGLAKDGEYFGLLVIGDSMNLDRICEGDIVIVRKQNIVENGEIAVVLVDEENATIKRFYKTDSTITLVPHSSNPEHKPRVIDPSKVSVKILGKVVRAVINF